MNKDKHIYKGKLYTELEANLPSEYFEKIKPILDSARNDLIQRLINRPKNTGQCFLRWENELETAIIRQFGSLEKKVP